MANKDKNTIRRKKAYFIDHTSLPTENALWDISTDIQVLRPDGTIHNVKFPPETRYLYFRLTKAVSWEQSDKPIKWSIRKMMQSLGWGKDKLLKHLDLLEFIGLIDVHREPGGRNEYTVNSLRTSYILYDRKDEKGNYVHQEIRYYIEAMKEKRGDFIKDIDPFMLTILQKFGISEEDLSPKEYKALKEILDSGLYEEPDILKEAIQLAKEGKGIADFIYHFSGIETQTIQERQERLGGTISLRDGAEILGLAEKEKDRD